jgi:D-amino-acid dehydrogenase
MIGDRPDPSLPTVVIGAGVVGVMTAYSLTRRGRRVALIDRLPGPAELCSRANAGILAVGHATAWAGPDAFGPMLRAVTARDPAVRITRSMDPALWRWGIEFLRHCTPAAHRTNSDKLKRLSRFSRDLLPASEAAMGLPQETAHDGGLYLFQDAAAFDAHMASLGEAQDDTVDVLDREALVALEPALAAMADRLVGGLLSKADSVGDCRLFTKRTCDYLVRSNTADVLFDRSVTGFRMNSSVIEAVETDAGPLPCAEVVLATGVETRDLCRPLGFSPQIYPVKGYSGTWRVLDPAAVPRLPFVDETELVGVAHYGDRLRVTAIAEFAGRDHSLPEDRITYLDRYVRRNFGSAVDLETPEFWTGLRPSTPAGPPYLGRVRRADNLWINAGHGQLGWTMSFGCGEILAQMISGEQPALSGVSSTARWLDPA